MIAATLIRPRRQGGEIRYFEGSRNDADSTDPDLRVSQPEDDDDSRTADDPILWDDREFERAPRAVLRRVLLGVLSDPDQRGRMTRILFPMLADGTPARRRLVYETLREFAEPQEILIASLQLYLRDGDFEALVTGAGLLEDLGARSWPVLAAYARRIPLACAYFVPVIARLEGISVGDRLVVLEILARSEDPELRWRVREALEGFPPDDTIRVLRAFAEAEDEDPARTALEERPQGHVAQ